MNHWNEYDEDDDDAIPNPKTPQRYTDWDDETDE
jgi:hypothetical protein